MSNWKTKQYEIKLKISQQDLEDLQSSLGQIQSQILTKLQKSFHKEVIRKEREKDIKNRVKK